METLLYHHPYLKMTLAVQSSLLELGAGLVIIIGWQTKLAAAALALFTIASAVLFHHNFSDQMQTIMFMKNITISGGLMLLAVYGAGACSLDNRSSKNVADKFFDKIE
ncbi:MAG: DoxX family protein [Nitrosomonas sp.]